VCASRRHSRRRADEVEQRLVDLIGVRPGDVVRAAFDCNELDVVDQIRQAWQASFNVAAGASPFASYACVDTWLTDFRGDLARIDIPVLVVHGTDDRILPFDATAARLPDLIDDVTLVAVEGGPHNIAWTHPDEVNEALLEFIGAPARVAA
jgi:pimeloyl-ACP methyl ester carboxylesterase